MNLFIIVEDSKDHSFLIESSMKKAVSQVETKTFECAENALQFLVSLPPSRYERVVVFLDLNLPGMNGIEFLEELRNDGYMKGIPVVILSTSDAIEDRRKALAAGSNSYLSKPIDFNDFQSMVKDASTYWAKWDKCAMHP